MNERLSIREECILTSAVSIVAASAKTDEHTWDWFNRTLAGSKAPEPATEAELQGLFSRLNRTPAVLVEIKAS